MKHSRKEEREFDEMMREEIESGNPFSQYSSYRSYRASNRKKPTENELPKNELSEMVKYCIKNT